MEIPDKVLLDPQEEKYNLKSVVHHIGTTAFSGHYTADALRDDDEWITFDDAQAFESSPTRNQRTAYMVLYAL